MWHKGMEKALCNMMPEDVVAEIKQQAKGKRWSSLPSGLKWETVYKYVNAKYVVCNVMKATRCLYEPQCA